MADFTQVATNEDIAAIADAIRQAGETSDDLTIPQMPAKILALHKTLIEKTITENGEYLPASDDADGYSKVTVSVGGLPPISEITNLAGTKWYMNEHITTTLPEFYYRVSGAYDLLQYTPSGRGFALMYFTRGTDVRLIGFSASGGSYSTLTMDWYKNNAFGNQDARTITIAGGMDQQNADLVAWFKANATLIGYMPQQ